MVCLDVLKTSFSSFIVFQFKTGPPETSGCSLTKAVEDISEFSCAQTETLKQKQEVLSYLQATLSDVEMKGETAEQELRSKVRETLILEAEIDHLEHQTKVLHDRCVSISEENTALQFELVEEEEVAQITRAKYCTYRNKMKHHRAAVLHMANQTEAHKELEKKREMVLMLTQRKEELRLDLENPNGNTVQTAKREVDALKQEVSWKRTTTTEKRERLQKELETQAHIKKDVEIQNRRYEAIVKRLHCQLSRAQAVHRQMSEEIYHMEKQVAELKRQLESSQDSVVSDQ
ncbi:uncharacterized protein V6R79_018913 [Siganus canaliculatus]